MVSIIFHEYKTYFLIGAAILALIIGFLSYNYFTNIDSTDFEQILLVAEDLNPGAQISFDTVAKRKVHRNLLTENVIHISDIDKILGSHTKTKLSKGDFIRWSDLNFNSTNPIVSSIPEGMRALALPQSPVSSVGGKIRPGDKIDVLGTFSSESSGPGLTSFVLENALVLSIGNIDPSSNSTTDPLILTVSPKDAAILTFARTHGELTFVLRNPEDSSITQNFSKITYHDIPGLSSPIAPKIRVIRSTNTQKNLYD